MNLVQINERLKDLPMQVLQQYANGMNPEVPPYLALGELQRREISQKQAATAQGGQQGPQPSVKEQVEQKAGLMAAQALQQQQAMQQMRQPRGPMPAPADIPQPEAQPEAMARGGLAGVPVRRDMFEYAGGGIIAFQAGGKPPRIQDEVPISEEERERLRNELLARLVGEEARNPPAPRRPPMEMTEQDLTSIPGMESSDLMARALANARGPQPDNRAMLNAVNEKDDRRTAMLEREAAKAVSRPKYETPYDRMNRKNRGELTPEEIAEERANQPRVINLPRGTSSQEVELIRMQNPDAQVRVEGEGSILRDIGDRYSKNVAGLKEGLAKAFSYSSDAEAQKQRQRPQASYSNEGRQTPAASQAPYSNEGRQLPVGIPAALPKSTTAATAPVALQKGPAASGAIPAAPRLAPTGAPAGLPAAAAAKAPVQTGAPQGTSPFLAEAATMAREKPVAPTPESIIAEQNKLLPPAMQEAAVQKMIADQRARAEARKTAYEESKPSGLDDLIRVFGQAGQYKGLSGMGPAYTANLDRKRAEDLAFQKQQDELLTAIEGRQYAADKELFGAREKSLTAAQTAYQNRLTSNTKVLADLAGVDQRRLDEIAQNLNRMEVAKLQAATANRPSEAERIEAKYMGMLAKGQTKEAEDYLNTISKIKGGGAAGVGAGRNAIMERRLEMQNLEKIMKDEGMQFSEEQKKEAAQEYRRLALMNTRESGGGSSAATGTPLPANASAKNLVVGTVYQTAKGPAKWTGTGFMPI